jgi:hypothetical protein
MNDWTGRRDAAFVLWFGEILPMAATASGPITAN